MLQDRGRRVDVKHVRFHRPRPEAIRFDSLPHRDRHVLSCATSGDTSRRLRTAKIDPAPLAHRSGIADLLQGEQEIVHFVAGKHAFDDRKAICSHAALGVGCSDHGFQFRWPAATRLRCQMDVGQQDRYAEGSWSARRKLGPFHDDLFAEFFPRKIA